jgi:hypothetical protein
VSALSGTKPPSRSDILWEKIEPRYMTAKAAKALPDGSVVALLWAGKEQPGRGPAMSAGIVRYTSNLKDTWWGPINYGKTQNMEGTDIAFSADGTKIALSGHGGFRATGKFYTGKLVLVGAEDGTVLSYTEINAGGVPEMIYNECWGVVGVPGGFVLSCGTGIEGCSQVSAANKASCEAGQGDPSTPNMKFKPGLWQSMAAKVDLSGRLLWRRADSYGGPKAACRAEEGCIKFTAIASSASEWVVANSDGSLSFINDESHAGFGVMRLSAPKAVHLPPPKVECAADHGKVAPCCGQPPSDFDGGSVPASYACPASQPTCSAYVAGSRLGTCQAVTTPGSTKKPAPGFAAWFASAKSASASAKLRGN